MSSLGNRVKELRLKERLSQRDLAIKIDVSPSLISFIENDKNNPNFSIIANIAKIFNTTTDYLIFGDATSIKQDFYGENDDFIIRHNLVSRILSLPQVDQNTLLGIL